MARLASQAAAGYFKTQDNVLPHILRRFATVTQPGDYCIVDPCAGEGEAVAAFARHVFGTTKTYNNQGTRPDDVKLSLCLVEMEQQRADRCRSALNGVAYNSYGMVQTGDALAASFRGVGASALWLNPPYDLLRGERFETRFLRHWGRCLTAGGQLILIVPEYVLADLTIQLTTEYEDIEVLRYPTEVYAEYKQVVVLATRRALRGEALPLPPILELSDAASTPRSLPQGSLTVECRSLDVAALLLNTSPLLTLCKAAEPPKVGLAMKPKPAHVAMALGSGIFNGVRLSAEGKDDLLAKAVFQRTFVDVDTKLNEKGEIAKFTQIERPQLRLTTLNLRTGEYRELSPGTEPSGSASIENFADLLLAYGDSMVAAMRQRCPSLHNGEDDIDLPSLLRPLFPAQAQAVRACLKLLHRDETPLLLGELGSGKSCTALGVLLALNKGTKIPVHVDTVFAQPRSLPRVHKCLVVCPPHLVQNWKDEITTCLGDAATVFELRQPSDVDAMSQCSANLSIGLLSRESAKLGCGIAAGAQRITVQHKGRTLTGRRCPACGYGLDAELGDEKLAASRAVCGRTISHPLDRLARCAKAFRRLRSRGAQLDSDTLAPLRSEAAIALLRFALNHTTRLKQTWSTKRPRLDFDTEKKLVEALKLTQPHQRIARCVKHLFSDSYISRDFAHKLDDAALINALVDLGKWRNTECKEPLWQMTPSPLRYPLADYICKKHKRLYQLIIADEFHEYSSDGSAQERALHRLVSAIPLCLPLTGSLMNGYAKSLFRNLWAVSSRMRSEFAYDEAGKFAKLYGYQKRVLTGDAAKKAKVTEYGSASDRVVKTEGGERLSDAPGVLPSFVLRHILPLSVTLHKRDINPDDRVVDHDKQSIEVDDESSREGTALGLALKQAVKRDRFDGELAGKLFGQLAEYPSYYDRATCDTGNTTEGDFVAAYPENVGGATVYRCVGQKVNVRLNKEQWLISTLRREVAEGRNVLLFLWHKELAARLRMLCAEAGVDDAVVLLAEKVPARKRQEWIDREVIRKSKRVLITNPTCVMTGLNNLIHFATAVFFENPGCNPFVARQAVGRLDRITQKKDVRIYWPVYEGVQCALLDLLQNKTAISQQIDGIDPTAALEMAGGGGDSVVQSVDVGLAVYKYLGGE